jgi:hypothetical protein
MHDTVRPRGGAHASCLAHGHGESRSQFADTGRANSSMLMPGENISIRPTPVG